MLGSLFIVAMAFAGGALYRWRGMAHPWKKYFPRPFSQIAFALPYAAVTLAETNAYWAGGVLVVTTLAILTGHGGWHDLGTVIAKRTAETMEFIIRPLRNNLPRYWYDSLGLALSGLLITLPAGIVTANPFLAVSGLAKAPAYMGGRALGGDTAEGEFITGFLLWGFLAAIVVLA